MDYSDRIKHLRERLGLSQTEVANKTNINRVQYNQYENDYFTIPIKYLNTISDFFSVSVDYLLGFSDSKNYNNSSSEIDLKKAGDRLKEFRRDNNLTQVKLASILNTSFSNIAFYEKGRNLIATPFLFQICNKYKISADYLLGKIDNPKYLN